MADLSDYKILWKYVPRPAGMEVRFNAENLATGVIFQEVIPFGKDTPDEKQVNEAIAERLDRCEAAILERDAITEEPANPVTAAEVETYLKEQGILKGNETIETLKTKTAETAVE